MNSINIIGRITHPLKIKTAQGIAGKTEVCSFGISYNEKKHGASVTYYFNVTAWGKNAQNIAANFKKGDRIGISGKLVQQEYTAKNGEKKKEVNLHLLSFVFIEPKEKEKLPTKQEDESTKE